MGIQWGNMGNTGNCRHPGNTFLSFRVVGEWDFPGLGLRQSAIFIGEYNQYNPGKNVNQLNTGLNTTHHETLRLPPQSLPPQRANPY